MAMTQTLTKACTDTTAAGTNTLKAAAIVNGTIDAVVAAIAKAGTFTPRQLQAVNALKAGVNSATVRIAIYGA